MTHANHSVELNIIAASDVRRYAADVLLPQPKREAVEHVLLDDDRARNLVVKVSKRCPKSMSRQFEVKLRQACNAGMNAVNAYYALAGMNDASSRTRAFAASRIRSRKSLLQSLGKLLPQEQAASLNVQARSISGLNSTQHSHADLAERIAELDRLFVRALRACFNAPSHPYYKAKIASLIAVIENEHDRIHWNRDPLNRTPV